MENAEDSLMKCVPHILMRESHNTLVKMHILGHSNVD